MGETILRSFLGILAMAAGFAIGLSAAKSSGPTRDQVYKEGFELGQRMAQAESMTTEIRAKLQRLSENDAANSSLQRQLREPPPEPEFGTEGEYTGIDRTTTAKARATKSGDPCSSYESGSYEANRCAAGQQAMSGMDREELSNRCTHSSDYNDCVEKEYMLRGAQAQQDDARRQYEEQQRRYYPQRRPY